MGTDHSLGTLISIADHPRLRRRLTELRISTHYLLATKKDIKSGWQYYSSKQADYFSHAKGVSFLTVALSKIPVLRSVEVGQWCPPCEQLQKPFGGSKIESETEERLVAHDCEMRYKYLLNDFDDSDDDDFDDEEDPYVLGGLTYNFSDLLKALAASDKRPEQISAALWAHHVQAWALQGIELSDMPEVRLGSSLEPGMYVVSDTQ